MARVVDCLMFHRQKSAVDLGSWFAVHGHVGCSSRNGDDRIDQGTLLGTGFRYSTWILALNRVEIEYLENEIPIQNEEYSFLSWEA